MSLSSSDFDHLSPQQKRQLLSALLQKRSSQPKDRPLSVGQERLYRLADLNPDVPLYNVAVAYRLSGRLDVNAMEQAVRRIGERHETLRTTFPLVGNKPVQRIEPAQSRSDIFLKIDLDTVPELDRRQRADQEIQREITRAINLAQAPLWRVALLRLSEHEHIVVLTMHHIITDGWSFDLFLKELTGLYAGLQAGRRWLARCSHDPIFRIR